MEFTNGDVQRKDEPATAVSFTEAMRHGEVTYIKEETTAIPNMVNQLRYAYYSHSVVFVEVEVDEDLGQSCVRRVVSATAGVPAAISNAIYHATGKRMRDFPITLDKLRWGLC